MSETLAPIACCAPLAAPELNEDETAATAALFAALGNPARVRIVNLLAAGDGPVCLCNLIEPLGLAQATVSQHLKRLVEAGLVLREERGKWSYFSLDAAAFERVAALALLPSVLLMSTTTDELREEVRLRYAESARRVVEGRAEGCGCGSGSCCADGENDAGRFGEALYDAEQRGALPEAATLASLGCGNPTAVADLREGETVLDLGSGGGIDVILSAKRVGPTGTAYGIDMTDEMLALARQNAAESGVANVHFLKGEIERIPLAATSVDVITSNCVINLSVDKPAVMMEMARVLRPGGRIGISDVVAEDRLTPGERTERGSYVGCIAGALAKNEYEALLDAAGFEQVSVEFTHEVADGMHGAIVKAVRTSQPAAKGLPVIQPAVKAGCC